MRMRLSKIRRAPATGRAWTPLGQAHMPTI
jgi:hypothetical protein